MRAISRHSESQYTCSYGPLVKVKTYGTSLSTFHCSTISQMQGKQHDTVSLMQGKQHDTISSFDVAGNQATQAGVVDFTFNYIQYIIRVPIPGIMLQRNTN